MRRILPQAIRYPLFFTGMMLMISAGFANRYIHSFGLFDTAITVAIGFILFMASVAL